MRTIGVIARIALVVAYPFLVWVGLSRGSARICGLATAAVALVLIASRLRDARTEHLRTVVAAPFSLLCLGIAGAVLDDARFVLAMPVLVNAVLLVQFGASLASVPMVERFARLVDPDLSEAQVLYCRTVTKVWCVYFVSNGGIAAVLAFFGLVDAWAIHTGIVGYLGMGVLGGVEYVVRKVRFRKFGDHLINRALRRVIVERVDASPNVESSP